MADATISARVWLALVNVQFAILTLEALLADALVRPNQIFAVATVPTGLTLALVDLLLTVGTRVALLAATAMGVSNVLASSFVAQLLHVDTLPGGSVLARDHLDVTQLTGPSGRAHALVNVFPLGT